MARQPQKKNIESRLTAVERGIRSLQTNNTTIIAIIKDMQEGFARMENRLEQVYDHVHGFMKLHETLDIEFRVIKEQVRRLEARVEHQEASGRS
jgi:predicted RNase H-like nuclease (RuvC/YqgF family)